MPTPTRKMNRRAFTLAELIIVMMIITLLVAILLPALSGARERGRKAAAATQLENISTACESYALSFNAYPGPSSTAKLGFWGSGGYAATWSGSLDLVAGLLGGTVTGNAKNNGGPYGDTSGALNTFSFDNDAVGVGPVAVTAGSISKKYGAFYSPKAEELRAVTTGYSTYDSTPPLKHIVDTNFSGMPILYYRAAPTQTTIGAWNYSGPTSPNATFSSCYNGAIVASTALTTVGGDSGPFAQRNTTSGSLIEDQSAGGASNVASNMQWVFANRAIDPNAPRGKFVLINAGKDGVYYGKNQQGRNNPGQGTIQNQADYDSFDDLSTAGG